METKPLKVIEEHVCGVLGEFNSGAGEAQYAVQRMSNLHWYWVRWAKRRATADGIIYCPYCGKKL